MNWLESFVGKYVATRVEVPSDRRGETIPAGTSLLVLEMAGDQHFNLVWPGAPFRRAANQVHYSKLMTSLDNAEAAKGTKQCWT